MEIRYTGFDEYARFEVSFEKVSSSILYATNTWALQVLEVIT
jgi:hypothetical protein